MVRVHLYFGAKKQETEEARRLKVYLAGGIQGVTDPFMWRKQTSEYLAKFGIEVLDPLRGKTPESFDSYNEREIITRDKQDIRECDLVFAEVTNPHRPYIGTSMEILYAWEHEKPVVVWGDYMSYWLTYHSVAQFKEWQDCMDYIVSFWRNENGY